VSANEDLEKRAAAAVAYVLKARAKRRDRRLCLRGTTPSLPRFGSPHLSVDELDTARVERETEAPWNRLLS
jgi:hypothetical protein